jgi:protein-S-isoprenylcysteine O-methyltransferase Ste14
MNKILSVSYSLISYLIFFVVFLYLIAFVGDLFVAKTVSSGEPQALFKALFINTFLIVLFAVQHTVMARSNFKQWLTRYIPAHLERSTYMLATSLILALLYCTWQPVSGTVWTFSHPVFVTFFYALFAVGWLMVLVATFLTNHFDLFGLRQVYLYFRDEPYTPVKFSEHFFYHYLRHPMMLGLLIAFWSTPVMTVSHLLFSLGMSIYIFVGIRFEEKNLVSLLGDDYVQYQQNTPMLFPCSGCSKNKSE